MLTDIAKFRGHKGLATVVVMEDGKQVAILAQHMATLEKAFKALVMPHAAPFDRKQAKRSIIISQDLLG